eukprot:TRINITY_DN457_c0_g4_i1.p1 TRINITY_DN457_c0_g4~~TRINITY_DN457_c0_g4_i1.p1  ORF type:complete len:404 (-),score=102.65 TRINITY_DN457_c0_g4_i1:152-1363(-)
MSNFDSLPNELKEKIFSYLSLEECRNICFVNSEWQSIYFQSRNELVIEDIEIKRKNDNNEENELELDENEGLTEFEIYKNKIKYLKKEYEKMKKKDNSKDDSNNNNNNNNEGNDEEEDNEKINEEEKALLHFVNNCRRLKKLKMSSRFLTTKGIMYIFSSNPLQLLTELCIGYCKEIDIKILSKLLYDSSMIENLKMLGLTSMGITDSDIIVLIKTLLNTKKVRSLEYLDLSKNKISKGGAKCLGYILNDSKNTTISKSLTGLDLSYNQLNDNGVSQLTNAFSGKNSTLFKLNLSHNNITKLKPVAHLIRCCTPISHLNLSHNMITHLGIVQFVPILQYDCTIEHLDLSYNKISDHSAMLLARSLLLNTTLKYLRLSENPISHKITLLMLNVPSFKTIREIVI